GAASSRAMAATAASEPSIQTSTRVGWLMGRVGTWRDPSVQGGPGPAVAMRTVFAMAGAGPPCTCLARQGAVRGPWPGRQVPASRRGRARGPCKDCEICDRRRAAPRASCAPAPDLRRAGCLGWRPDLHAPAAQGEPAAMSQPADLATASVARAADAFVRDFERLLQGSWELP